MDDQPSLPGLGPPDPPARPAAPPRDPTDDAPWTGWDWDARARVGAAIRIRLGYWPRCDICDKPMVLAQDGMHEVCRQALADATEDDR